MAGDLWKPEGDPKGSGAGKLVFLAAQNHGSTLYVVDAKTGKILDKGNLQKRYEDGRYIYRFNKSGASFKDVVIIDANGNHTYIPDGSSRGDGNSITWSQSSVKAGSNGEPIFNASQFNLSTSDGWRWSGGSSLNGVNSGGRVGNVYVPELLDPSQLSFNRTELEFTDPIETLRKLAEENRGQMSENYLESLQRSGQISEANKNQLVDYLNTMSPLQLQMVGIENAFNQQQKLQAAETAQPGITDLLRGEVKNAQTLTSGRLLRDAEDRALEQTARSAGADVAWTRGLGDDSLVGKRLSDQLSVSQRLGIMTQGQNYMNTAVQLANTTLMDTPNKAGLSQQIPGTPQVPFSNIISEQQTRLDQATTLSPDSAQSSITSQRTAQAQLDAQLQSDYNKYMLDIMSSNLQAKNTFGQDVINDELNTANNEATKARNEAYRQLYWAKQAGLIKDERVEKEILAQIEQTGTVNMSDYIKGWETRWANHLQELGEIPITTTPTNTGGASKQITIGGVTFQVSGGKIVNSNGTIVLPYISRYSDASTLTDYINSIINDNDFSGVF